MNKVIKVIKMYIAIYYISGRGFTDVSLRV